MAQFRQLELELDDARVRIPWGGQTPRSLTKVQKALFLSQAAKKCKRFFVDPEQTDLFRAAKKGPPRYEGAPSLFPLPRGGG